MTEKKKKKPNERQHYSTRGNNVPMSPLFLCRGADFGSISDFSLVAIRRPGLILA